MNAMFERSAKIVVNDEYVAEQRRQMIARAEAILALPKTGPFEYGGRVLDNIDMLSLHIYAQTPQMRFARRVDEWCQRFERWVENEYGVSATSEPGDR